MCFKCEDPYCGCICRFDITEIAGGITAKFCKYCGHYNVVDSWRPQAYG